MTIAIAVVVQPVVCTVHHTHRAEQMSIAVQTGMKGCYRLPQTAS